MADYLQTFNLAHDEDFRKRIQTAILVISRDVLNEGAEDTTGPRHTLARQASRLDDPVLDRFAWECALNPAVAAAEVAARGSAADSDLAYVVASAWDSAAGVA